VISRHWKGTTKPGRADAYIEHLETETFPQLKSIPGFVRASILRRAVDAGTEFQIVTVWESFGAIQAFAGDDPGVAVVPEAARALMANYDERVVHYDVVRSFDPS
jgi:heme-degrading monooxygenase HmoA